jgi:hypothetical protein
MQPKPTAETCGPLRPNWRVFMRELSGYVLLGAIMRVSTPTFVNRDVAAAGVIGNKNTGRLYRSLQELTQPNRVGETPCPLILRN